MQEVLERSGISRERFQRRFGSKEACFAQAYEMAADRLCAEVLEAGREGRELAGGLPRRPGQAAAHRRRAAAAGEGAADRGAGRARPGLGQAPAGWSSASPHAVDSARQEPGCAARPPPSPPSSWSARSRKRSAPRSAPAAPPTVERLLPDLTHLAVLNYFGEDEAWLELRSPDLTPVDQGPELRSGRLLGELRPRRCRGTGSG